MFKNPFDVILHGDGDVGDKAGKNTPQNPDKPSI